SASAYSVVKLKLECIVIARLSSITHCSLTRVIRIIRNFNRRIASVGNALLFLRDSGIHCIVGNDVFLRTRLTDITNVLDFNVGESLKLRYTQVFLLRSEERRVGNECRTGEDADEIQ